MKKQSHSKIKWPNETCNPVKGLCPNTECEIRRHCYALKMYKRFKWNPELRLDMSVFDKLENTAPSRIFVGSTCELFHPDLPSSWIAEIIDRANEMTQHNFLFLTKCPKWAQWNFAPHCWLGVSVTTHETLKRIEILGFLKDEGHVDHIFVSFEPVTEQILVGGAFDPHEVLAGVDWCIVGAMTPYNWDTYPLLEWIQAIVAVAHLSHVPIWMKENLLIQKTPRDIIQDTSNRKLLPSLRVSFQPGNDECHECEHWSDCLDANMERTYKEI